MKNKINIYLASPRGFCAGVDRAIEIVKKSIDKYGAPVYVRHEIVHNKHVVESLKKIGAIFVEELSEINDKTRPVIFSAHGVPKSVPKEASNLKMEYIDATCPLVSKVHREAENLNKKGYHILLIGHKNHITLFCNFFNSSLPIRCCITNIFFFWFFNFWKFFL